MAKTIEYKGFKIGDRVVIKTTAHPEWESHQQFINQHGYIRSIAKTKNIVWIRCDFGKDFGAYPENIEKEA